jgi:hypothetical protein
MAGEQRRRWFGSSVQPAGLLICAWFLFRLLAGLHLSLMGVVTTGQTGLLPPGQFQEEDEDVPYFYQTDPPREMPLTGWRRGIDYGGQKLTVVYSPLVSSYHVASVREFDKPTGLWREDTFLVRMFLYAVGVGFGLLVFALPRLLSRDGARFSLLPGLDRDDPLSGR